VTDVAPSKNAVYDEMELRAPKASPVFTGTVSASEQPSFFAYISSDRLGVTGDGTVYSLTGAFWTESRDIGGCFSNGTFTAPKTGLYILSGAFSLSKVNADSFEARLVTTGRVYYISPVLKSYYVTDWGYLNFPWSQVVYLTKGQTAYLTLKVTFNPTNKISEILADSTLFAGYALP
jgi:hypothetical protein